jgi:hypothetical protein
LSRLPSSRGSSASTATRAAGPRRIAAPGQPAPKSGIYESLLWIALGAIGLGLILMLLLFSQYGFSVSVPK